MLQSNLIHHAIDHKSTVKVTFKDVTRSPMIGRFVSFEDPKNVRFVAQSRLEQWDGTGEISCTRLHNINNFQYIQVCQ